MADKKGHTEEEYAALEYKSPTVRPPEIGYRTLAQYPGNSSLNYFWLDHLVGAADQWEGHSNAERLGGLEI